MTGRGVGLARATVTVRVDGADKTNDCLELELDTWERSGSRIVGRGVAEIAIRNEKGQMTVDEEAGWVRRRTEAGQIEIVFGSEEFAKLAAAGGME
jgi:hypothetical protein